MNFILGFDLISSNVEVVSDLYEAGKQDDGHPFIAEVFYVELTLPDGERFRHPIRWAGCRVEYSEEPETYGEAFFYDVRQEARAAANRLCERVRRAGRINQALWDGVDPAYGSEAYQREGIEIERAYADRFAA